MKNLLRFTLVTVLVLSLSPLRSEKVIDWESELLKIEKEYLKGDYKKVLPQSQALVKKIEKKAGSESMIRARALAQLAKIYEAASKFDDYRTTIDLSVNTLNLAPKENHNEYGKTLSWVAEALIQYGDFVRAEEMIQKAVKLIQENKILDPVIANEIKSKQAEVYYHQGYLVKAETMIPALINERKARIVSKEPYTDDKGRTKQRKLSKGEVAARTRSAVDLMNFYSLVTFENGNYAKTDSLIEANGSYIRKQFNKKDVAYIENTFQKGLLLEALQKHFEANEKFERAAKHSITSKGIRLKPMSKQTIRLQEKRIVSHKRVKREGQANKREKIHKTRVERAYGKNSIYFARYRLVEAEEYLYAKDFKKAEDRVTEILNNPLYFSKNHPEKIRALKILHYVYLETDQYKKAEECLVQIVDARKELHGKDAPTYQMANLELASFYTGFSSQFKKAEDIYSSSYEKVSKEIDHRNKHFLNYVYSYSDLYEYTDHFEKSLEILQTALEDTKKYYGERHPKYATALERTANAYIDLGRYADAEKNLSQAEEIFKKEGTSVDYKEYSHALETFARLYIIQGQYDEAKKVLRKAVQKQEFVGAEVKISSAIEELATLYIETGKYQETEKSLKAAIKLKEAKYGNVHRTLVNPLNQLGHLYLITGNYVEAEKHTKRAAKISIEIFGESSIKYAESLKLLGDIYASIGDYEKAEDEIQKALIIQKHQYGKNHIQIAKSISDIALIKYYNNVDPAEVEKLLLEALRMTKESLNDKHPQYASILNHLALFYLETGNMAKSESLLDQANAIWINKFGENNRHSAEIYFIKGNISFKKENYIQAKTDYTNAKNIYQRVFDASHPGYLKAVSKIGQMSYITGDYKDAVKNLDESTSSYLTFIHTIFPSLSEREKTKFWNNIQNDFEFYNTLAIKLKDENPMLLSNAYNFALSTKALLLSSSIKVRQRIMESMDQELIQKFEKWLGKKEFLTSVISMTSEQRKESEIDLKALEAEIETLEKELSSKSEVFAQNFQKKQAYDWREIRKNLAENEAAIEIIRFRLFSKSFTDTIMYAALIVTPEAKSFPTVVLLNNGKEMEEKWLKYYRNCMKYNVEDKTSFEHFWKPIKEYVKDNTKVYFSPDGVYNQINLETLYSSEKQYVLDQNEIVLVSNTRDLISRKLDLEKAAKASKKNVVEPKETSNKIILFGNPNYYASNYVAMDPIASGDSNVVVGTQRKISQLPGAEKEVKDLHDLLNKSGWDSEAFLNEGATEARLKELKNVRVFHIATHGFFMEDVYASTDLEGINQNRAVQNPLHRSGLLLKDGGNLMENDNVYEFNSSDGILTAYEAMNLNFDNTDLVVLSACETGLGKVQLGEGVYGLQRSFLVAGSKTIIMSLFKVSDEVTQELMNLFYANWIKGGDKRKAFIDAKKSIKEKYKRPIYWGAFIMTGLD